MPTPLTGFAVSGLMQQEDSIGMILVLHSLTCSKWHDGHTKKGQGKGLREQPVDMSMRGHCVVWSNIEERSHRMLVYASWKGRDGCPGFKVISNRRRKIKLTLCATDPKICLPTLRNMQLTDTSASPQGLAVLERSKKKEKQQHLVTFPH